MSPSLRLLEVAPSRRVLSPPRSGAWPNALPEHYFVPAVRPAPFAALFAGPAPGDRSCTSFLPPGSMQSPLAWPEIYGDHQSTFSYGRCWLRLLALGRSPHFAWPASRYAYPVDSPGQVAWPAALYAPPLLARAPLALRHPCPAPGAFSGFQQTLFFRPG